MFQSLLHKLILNLHACMHAYTTGAYVKTKNRYKSGYLVGKKKFFRDTNFFKDLFFFYTSPSQCIYNKFYTIEILNDIQCVYKYLGLYPDVPWISA